MPELPEVETVVQTLRPKLIDQQLTAIQALNSATVVYKNPFEPFIIKNIVRRGKYIILMGDDHFLTIHLRMTGRLLEKATNKKFIRAILAFTNSSLHFEDMRKFGRIVFATGIELEALPGIRNLGPEPWQEQLDKSFYQQLQRSNATIKSFLLNQKNIAGIGNIYADEICFHAYINPLTVSKSITASIAKRLLNSIRYILNKAITLRGTTFAHFIDADGKKGNNFEYLQAYGRKGKSCFRCNTPLTTIKIHNRTTVYCPACQKIPGNKKEVCTAADSLYILHLHTFLKRCRKILRRIFGDHPP
ncbi:MAG: bifunctional DNA-formamidopyrimidine glycosylase/DNA-(apurinic or apyrimidinic site) lyase [Candidatus Abawacabacteria bacterium]|nr:bifunctional DNA-formamidopyrimidine glycosylase/DNA-(apurinic or apyrimidinic site) lyase [Candidatus Abawacabacteria bacterium]